MTDEEMTALTADTDNKSEKVRRLYNAGVPTARIGEFLGIRYQFTYNVLLRAGLIVKPGEREAPAAVSDVMVLSLGKDGGVQLPDAFLAEHGLTAGAPLVCRSTPEGLVIMSRERAVDYLREVALARMPGEAALLEALLGSPQRSDNPHPSG